MTDQISSTPEQVDEWTALAHMHPVLHEVLPGASVERVEHWQANKHTIQLWNQSSKPFFIKFYSDTNRKMLEELQIDGSGGQAGGAFG